MILIERAQHYIIMLEKAISKKFIPRQNVTRGIQGQCQNCISFLLYFNVTYNDVILPVEEFRNDRFISPYKILVLPTLRPSNARSCSSHTHFLSRFFLCIIFNFVSFIKLYLRSFFYTLQPFVLMKENHWYQLTRNATRQ